MSVGVIVVGAVEQLVLTLIILVAVLVLLRFLLSLFHADPWHPLTRGIKTMAKPFVRPFDGIVTIRSSIDIEALIATRLERDANRRFTGRIEGTPAFREGKVTRVGQWLAESGASWGDFDRVSVYSDSLNDLLLLERATEPVAVNPSPDLEALARERGWRIMKLFE